MKLRGRNKIGKTLGKKIHRNAQNDLKEKGNP